MKTFLLSVVVLAALDCKMHSQVNGTPNPMPTVTGTAVSAGFTPDELRSFTALEPIDTHTHVRRIGPAFNAMLDRLHVHLLDIILVDDLDPEERNLKSERENAVAFIRSSKGHAVLCSTIDPYKIGSPGFAASAVHDLDNDFANGAVAVKLWKNVGMEIKDAKGNYIFPDDPALAPVYRDIAAHNRTLVAHFADPDSAWAPLDPASPDYSYYSQHSEWYMHGKASVPSKEKILAARDHVIEQNPKLRVVGAHLGSMEANLSVLADHLDRYPNFAVDLASRIPYFALQPRDQAIAFILKYQDRLIYATDLTFQTSDEPESRSRHWEETYAREWRFLATDETVQFETVKARGLALPDSVLRKIYHDNAVRWFPGIIPSR